MVNKILATVLSVLIASGILASVSLGNRITVVEEKEKVSDYRWAEFRGDMDYLLCAHGENSKCKTRAK